MPKRHLSDEQVIPSGPVHVRVEDHHLAVRAGRPPGAVPVRDPDRVVVQEQALVAAVGALDADRLVPQQQGRPRLHAGPRKIGPLPAQVPPHLGVGLDPVAGLIRPQSRRAVGQYLRLDELATADVVALLSEGGSEPRVRADPHAPTTRGSLPPSLKSATTSAVASSSRRRYWP